MSGRLIDAVHAVHPDVNVEELADAVWLLDEVYRARSAGGGRARPDPPEPERPGGTPTAGSRPPGEPTPVPAPNAGPPPARVDTLPSPSPPGNEAHWHLPRADRLLEENTRVPVRSPAAAALPGTLAIARALRPLRRRLPSRTALVVDEEATVRRAADADLWVPVRRPAPGRWLDLALVVDDSASMVIWRRTCTELAELLERLGVFRDVRVWRWDTDRPASDPRPPLRPAGAAAEAGGHDRAELVDPSGRRAVLVVSDCVGRAWQTGEMSRALRLWGQAGPVAIVQTLPQRLWEACAPEIVPAWFGAGRPGAPNAHLRVRAEPPGQVIAAAVPVPVLELAPRWLAPWARLVAGSGPEWTSAMAVLADGAASPPAPGAPAGASPDELLARYASFASTEAMRLAACLAGAPLSLPVMRLVQRAMLPGSRPSVLAEVFLGGLLHRRPGSGREPDPDNVEYEFVPGVRDRLLEALPRQDKVAVLAKVSADVASRLGSPVDFRAFLSAADDAVAVLERDRPFARVALQVLDNLGGRYAEAAGQLRRKAEGLPPVAAPEADPAHPGTDDTRDPDISADNVDYRRPAPELATSPGEAVVSSAPSTAAPPERHDVRAERRPEGTQQPAIFGGVPYRNPHFTGRADMLERLHTALVHGTSRMALLPHALHGMGGVGKTQLAVEYAYRYAAEYDLVWWVPAESPTTVRQSLSRLAEEMRLPAGDVSQAVNNVLAALRTGDPHRRWLIVIDNADRPEDFKEFLPVPVGHILVTSRNPQWADVAADLEVDVFRREESVALLQQRGHGISAGEADALAEKLGDLPLAIDQAAAWQSETGMPAPELARMLDERINVLLTESPPTNYPVTVMATWELAFNRLQERSPGAAELLRLCAFFGTEPIAVPLLWDGRHADLPDPVARVLRDDILLRRAIREIHRYALAKVDPSRDLIEVHRLVQAVLREQLAPAERETMRDAVHGILGMANPADPENANTWPRHAELLPHVTPSGVVDAKTDTARRVLLDQMAYRFYYGDYVRSQDLAERAVSRWRETLGPDHELTLLAQRHLAMAMQETGDREDAAALNRETFARMREVFGVDHEHTLTTATNVSRDLRHNGEFGAARELDEDNLARCRRVFGDEHPETLRMMNNVAVNLRMQGDSAGALALDTETLHMYERIIGSNDRGTMISLVNVARDKFDAGRYDEAEQLLEEALPRVRDRVGEDNYVTLSYMYVLAMVRRRSGAYAAARDVAEELYLRARRIYRTGHERLIMAMATYANALLAVGELAPARSLAEQVLHQSRETFSPDHTFAHVAAVNLAVIMRAEEEYSAARELDESALAGLRQGLGDDHPYTLDAMLNLGTDQAHAHEHERARALSEDAHARSRRVRGEDHPATLACALNYSLDLRAVGQREAAQSLYEEVLVALLQRLGDSHPEYRAAADGRRPSAMWRFSGPDRHGPEAAAQRASHRASASGSTAVTPAAARRADSATRSSGSVV